MLVGFLKSTEGEASVFGYDMIRNMGMVRKFLGFCPQFDILYPQLTVNEHMKIFGHLRGIEEHERKAKTQQLLRDLQLSHQGDVQAKELSGGQRRKLSVALAFLGDNRLIILDEPSSVTIICF